MPNIITECEIKRSTVDPAVILINVKYDGDSKWELLRTYFPDEISFNPEEFIGLTDKEALSLCWERDLVYLRSWNDETEA